MEPHGQHSDLVNYLYQRLNELNASDLSRPNVVILRGPAGTGKMQIVQRSVRPAALLSSGLLLAGTH